MFTVRIDHPTQENFPERTVYCCSRYTVGFKSPFEAVMYLRVPGEDTDTEYLIGAGGVAYVMNDRGVTVDVVRTERRCDGNHSGSRCSDPQCWVVSSSSAAKEVTLTR